MRWCLLLLICHAGYFSFAEGLEQRLGMDNQLMRGHVLVVDDMPSNREIMRRMLTNNSYAVTLAEDGQQAIDILADSLFDLILLDVGMPKMDGFAVCKSVKADERTAGIPVIFISAQGDLGDKVRAFEAGAVDYITKPFKMEEVLARVNTQITLSQQKRQILHLNALKDQLIRTVSHELKNPIHIVMGYAALLMDEADMPPEQVAEMSTQIFRSAERMHRIVTNLLDITQIEEGEPWQLRRIALLGIVQDALHEHLFLAEQKQITLELDPFSRDVHVMADPVHLHQAFSNLVSNAIKYTPAGGEVHLGATFNEGNVTISVADNGLGIPQSALPRLFDKFFRVDTLDHREQEGTGLGLSIVKAIVDGHGGEITVASRPGAGSTFSVTLPVA